MSAARPALAFRGVAKSFSSAQGEIAVLRDLEFELGPGDFAAVTGPSGSGKSTCLHLAALLDRPSAGRVIFGGADTSSMPDAELCALRARKVGMVFQKYCLLPHRSIFDNVLFRFRYLDCGRAEAEARVEAALASVGLARISSRSARLLSGGEMQRVAIARAIALKPELLIADEPTGNLDRASAHAVMACFCALNDEGIAILMATHNEAMLPASTRHLRLGHGAVVAQAA